MSKYILSKLRDILAITIEYLKFLVNRYLPFITTIQELRKWGFIYSFSNLLSTLFFFIWHLEAIKSSLALYLFLLSTVLHLLIGSRFIRFSKFFSPIAFTKWIWLNLIFFSPIGLILGYFCLRSKYWILEASGLSDLNEAQRARERNMKNSFKYRKLESKFNQSLTFLKKINENKTKEILSIFLNIHKFIFEELNFFQISTIIAIAIILKQFKQKTFDHLIWGAHWYEDHFFTFGIKNTKPISALNKYPLIVGSIVLNESDNYRKILDKKIQIKQHLTFSDAKIISLHMGDEYKLFVNP